MSIMTEDEAVALSDTSRALRVYGFVRAMVRAVMFPFFRIRSSGTEHLSVGGPLVVAPVHRSNLDVAIVGALSNRRLRALAKQSLFANRFLGWLVAALGAVPLDRGVADRAALRAVRSLLDRGEAVIVFPEGTRQEGDEIGELFDGPAYLAAKSSARVVPIGIYGTEAAMPPGRRFPKRTRVGVTVGVPLDPPGERGRVSLSDRRAFTAELAVRLRDLQQEAKVLAGTVD